MTAVTTVLPRGPWTVDDLERVPGHLRYGWEVLDGELFVAPEPSLQHQRVNGLLWRALQDAAPADLEVFLPVDLRLSNIRQVQPDITVARRTDATGSFLDRPPLLVVEVLSPSNRGHDLSVKRELYEQAGVPSYWMVEPDNGEITVLELVDGTYAEIARGTTVSVEQPFPMTLSC